MSITPTGTPAWTRTASADLYGGHANKRNWGGLGIIDPRTDISAEQWSRMAADLAAVVTVSPALVIRVRDTGARTVAPSAPSPSITASVHSLWGVSGWYSGGFPATGFPTVELDDSDLSLPTYTITIPASHTDYFGVAASFAPVATVTTGVKISGGVMVYPCGETITGQVITLQFAGDDLALVSGNVDFVVQVW